MLILGLKRFIFQPKDWMPLYVQIIREGSDENSAVFPIYTFIGSKYAALNGAGEFLKDVKSSALIFSRINS